MQVILNFSSEKCQDILLFFLNISYSMGFWLGLLLLVFGENIYIFFVFSRKYSDIVEEY